MSFDLDIIRQTPDWIAVGKPVRLAVIPGRGESDSVLEALGRQIALPSSGSSDPRIRVVHRLDKETSGVLLFALNVATQRHLSHQFQNNTIEKEYVALAVGRFESPTGEIATQIGPHPTNKLRMAVVRHGGRPAMTRYEVVEAFRAYSYVRLFPKTGKTHQLRVHLAHIGHPLAIDPLYNAGSPAGGMLLSSFKRGYRAARDREERPLIERLPLHAEVLRFTDVDGQRVELTVPPPKDLRAVLQALVKYGR